MKIDLHMHSNYSFDSKMEINSIVNYALKNDVKYIAITDHVEFRFEGIDEVLKKFDKRNKYIDYLNFYYKDIKILNGVEIGSPHYYLGEVKKLVSQVPFDMTLGSVHYIDEQNFSKILDNYGINYLIDLYFKELDMLMDIPYIDVIAHLDYFKRYIGTDFYDEDLITSILKRIITNNKVLEINTSGFRRGNFESFPNVDTIELYKKLGGKYVTIGSDAHKEGELFDHVTMYDSKLDEFKIKKVVFEKRKIKVV